jgi:hypothetical protein
VLTSTESGPVTQRVDSIVRSLHARLGERVEAAVISAAVEEEFAAYSAARITQFVPIIVESRVRARLWPQRSAVDRAAGR